MTLDFWAKIEMEYAEHLAKALETLEELRENGILGDNRASEQDTGQSPEGLAAHDDPPHLDTRTES